MSTTPIHPRELAAALRRRLPVAVAVANSAGPDSTCLLFLLRQLFPPQSLLSIHVAHDLQPASAHMATLAAENARSLGIPHQLARVPWGVPPFPPVPASGPVERIARDARYNLLFAAITRARISLLALGHHADDQLETAIMRLARGSSLLGAAGMRPSRRWGMGSDDPLARFGHQGLDAFILRPLLSFPKDRILATCHAHHLQYVNDPTNSQPHITPRNAIRYCLHTDPPFSEPVALPPTASVSLDNIKNAASLLQSIAPGVVGQKERLYSAVTKLAARVDDVDLKVTSYLSEHALPSPIGTILLSSSKLLDIKDPDVRFALVLRVIRYVSFHPWGSLRADADRRQSSIHRIIRSLWASELVPQASRPKKFTAGGGVLWTPAIYKPPRVRNQCSRVVHDPGDRFCWLASRMPPFSKNPHHQGAGSPTRLVIDLTEQLAIATSSDTPVEPLQVLYDARFLLSMDPRQIPAHVKSALQDKTTSVKVLPFTHYYWPKVVLQRESRPDQVLAVPTEIGTVEAPSWISIQWVRPLDAT